jgi:hypothetical protein
MEKLSMSDQIEDGSVLIKLNMESDLDLRRES